MAGNQGGNKKRSRKPYTSLGLRASRAEKRGGIGVRRAPVFDNEVMGRFVKTQQDERWPTEDSCDAYAKANRAPAHRRPDKPIKPSKSGFTLFDMALHVGNEDHKNVGLMDLFMFASMTIKKLNRPPYYRVIKACSLGNRVLVLS